MCQLFKFNKLNRLNKYKKYNKAFTLMEVLIALFIFSIIAIMTMRGLQTTLQARKTSQVLLDQLAELETAYMIMQNDFAQIINRSVKKPNGDNEAALIVPVKTQATSGEIVVGETEHGLNRLAFTRSGKNTDIIRYKTSDLERVAYFVKDGLLIRHSWRQLDPSGNTLVDRQRILSKLKTLEINFVDDLGRITQDWQFIAEPNKFNNNQTFMLMPKGIIIKADIEQYGGLEWVFSLPGIYNKKQ